MLKLKNIFSDHAIFQQDTEITVSGWGEKDAQVELMLACEDGESSRFFGRSDENGRFDVKVLTPRGGWKEWTMRVSVGAETIVVSDILFGEVWLAGGQSNMEMFLSEVSDGEMVRPSVSGVRFFQNNPFEVDKKAWGEDPATWGVPRKTDVEDASGMWGSDKTREIQDKVSCIALVACAEMARTLGVPVGFVNYNLGGTTIETWLPYTRMDEFPELSERLKALGKWPDENCHNCCLLYHNIAPSMYGIKFRGALWYQGESNACNDDAKAYYREAMQMWHRVYSDLFKTDKGFPMICALLFPWIYGENTTCRAQINEAIVELASERPEDFYVIPTYDLPPVWSVNMGNHPIHPAHKTVLGKRFAKVVLAAAYGAQGTASAAWMKDWRIEGNRLLMEYETSGGKLEAKGDLDGFMVAGEDGLWQHAQAEIVSENTVAVWSETIDKPAGAIYQYLDTQLDGGLWCGDLPAAPASTSNIGFAPIQRRPWTNLKKDAVWVIDRIVGGENGTWKLLEAYYRPTWRPGEGSEICRDTAFTRTGCALRIAGDTSPVSAWVQPYPTMALDLEKFGRMTMDIFCYQNVEARLEVEVRLNECDVRTIRVFGKITKIHDDNWAEVEFVLPDNLKDVGKMKLVFDVDRPVKGVNIDHILLWAKK